MTTTAQDQFRIEQVQILNWGGYCGLQTMRAGRTSTAILGPSGRGKSTLLDAIASVIMPNPQEFNQAARDDQGRKRERTVYSYARGQTVHQRDENKRSATTAYLRPPGTPGFASGAAITWADGHGARVTALRLAWVGPDATDNDAITAATVYGFVHDLFDFTALQGLTPLPGSSSPLSRASLERLVDPDRGDIIDPAQSRVHTKMRRVMAMGASEESQRLAMLLLRRAQASKGVFSINGLFKDFVLTEPQALQRWDVTLEHYQEAARLFEEFELAHKKLDALHRLPEHVEHYQAAGQAYQAKQALLDDPPGLPRLRVWHAAQLAAWAAAAIEENRLDSGVARDELQRAEQHQATAQLAYDMAMDAVEAAGGDPAATLRVRLEQQQKDLAAVDTRRDELAARLGAFDQALPTTAGDLLLLQESLHTLHTRMQEELQELEAAHDERIGAAHDARKRLDAVTAELDQLRGQRTNVPPDALERRDRISRATGVPVDRLRYAGELLDIKAEDRGWQKAIVTVVLPLARDLIVDERDFPRVRAWVNDNHMRGDITLVRAAANRPLQDPIPRTVPAMLDIADSPYAGWLSDQLVSRFSLLCVERDTDLDAARPAGTTGAVTRHGMRTTHAGRVTKNDTPIRYPWIGWDNQQLRDQLEDERRSLAADLDVEKSRAQTAHHDVTRKDNRIRELDQLRTDLRWEDIDRDTVQRRLDALLAAMTAADTPAAAQRRTAVTTAQHDLSAAQADVRQLKATTEQLEEAWADLCTAEDEANDVLHAHPPLTEEETAATRYVPFTPPLDPAGRTASYQAAVTALHAQIAQHKADRETVGDTVLATVRAYRNISDRTARDVDDTLDSAPALLLIRDRLERDDLPRARDGWLRRVDEDLNQALRTVLTQIDSDSDVIRRGLAPINGVLRTVPFRQGSHLAIDVVDRPNSDLREFRQLVTEFTQDTPLGVDLFNDPDRVEASFVRLRQGLARLHDRSRMSEAWRRRVFDAREHVEFRAIETRPDGVEILHEGVAGMSGGEGQELIAFILGAALRYRLGEGGESLPRYGCIVLDEGFVKADSDYTGRALRALQALGFQLIVAAPREKATAFEDYVDLVAYITDDTDTPGVRIYPMTIQDAVDLEAAA